MKQKHKVWIKRIVVFVVLIAFCWVQNNWLTVSVYTYESTKIPAALDGYRVVQLSDLHNATFGVGNQWLLSKVAQLQPDIIVITGDVVDSTFTDIEVATMFAEQCVGIAPTYYITGNHEIWLEETERLSVLKELEKCGVVCLKDELVEISKGEGTFSLIGLNDESLMGNTLQNVLEGANKEQLQVLLAHEPQYLDNYAASSVDLVLTGHAHGGQFRLPFMGGVVAPGQGLFPKYTSGEHVKGTTTMIISRGLGNSVIPVRLFNLPEIVCVELERKNVDMKQWAN